MTWRRLASEGHAALAYPFSRFFQQHHPGPFGTTGRMSSGYFSRHGDTIHSVQQWPPTGPEGEEVIKGPILSSARSGGRTRNNTPTHTEAEERERERGAMC